MVKVAYYVTGGHTECGAIESFLGKINRNIKYERRFPAVNKPAAKIDRLHPVPVPADQGITGESLVDRMLDRLEQFPPDADYILLIDDTDCLFSCESDLIKYASKISEKINKLHPEKYTLLTLFQSPEIESWFVADRNNSFAVLYPEIKDILNRYLNSLYDGIDMIELFGQPRTASGCSKKLSVLIDDFMRSISTSTNFYGA